MTGADRARPGYPPALFDDLAALAGIGPGCRVLEIGCGTGQATVPLAERGCEIVAVEIGPHLAAVARRNLGRFLSAQVVTSAFEDWPLPPEPFDAVVSATAFHWLDPAVRVVKAADALCPGGALATIATHHIAGGTEDFFAAVQACYERWDPATPPGLRLPTARPLGPVRAGVVPAPRMGAGVLVCCLPRGAAHLFRPPRAWTCRPKEPSQLHRSADRVSLRWPHRQTSPDRVESCAPSTVTTDRATGSPGRRHHDLAGERGPGSGQVPNLQPVERARVVAEDLVDRRRIDPALSLQVAERLQLAGCVGMPVVRADDELTIPRVAQNVR